MKLFCAACEKEVSDNIAVYENVDGVIVHCGECMYPLLFVGYDEPNWFGNSEDLAEAVKENITNNSGEDMQQPGLFDFEDTSCSCACGCGEAIPAELDSDEDEDYSYLEFSSEDIALMERTMTAKVERQYKAMCKTEALLDKLRDLQELRGC